MRGISQIPYIAKKKKSTYKKREIQWWDGEHIYNVVRRPSGIHFAVSRPKRLGFSSDFFSNLLKSCHYFLVNRSEFEEKTTF
jgi:hypothetical protein